MSLKIIKDYYIKKKTKLIKNFDSILPILQQIFTKKLSDEKINELFNLIKQEYEDIIPEIPYIGGKKNIFTNYLIEGASVLAIIRILEKEGFTLWDIGEFLYNLSDINNKFRKIMMENTDKNPSQYPFEKEYMDYMKVLTKISQKKEYSVNWVADYVEGDGKTFEWGFNVYECGIHKFFKKYGAEKYVPLIWLSDFSEANIFGFRFSRTQTLSNGAPLCDHRYIKNVETPRAWTPDNIKEFKIKF